MDDQFAAVRSTSSIDVVGVFVPQDPGAKDKLAKQGQIAFDFGNSWTTGLSMGTGQAPPKRYDREPRDLIHLGKAKPSLIVSREITLAGASDAYEHFNKRDDGWTKVLLHLGQ